MDLVTFTEEILHRKLYFCEIFFQEFLLRARSLVVSDLRSETKGSRFESGC